MPKRKREIDEGAESAALQVPCGRCKAKPHVPCVALISAQRMMLIQSMDDPAKREKALKPKNAKRAHACRRNDGQKWVSWHKGIK